MNMSSFLPFSSNRLSKTNNPVYNVFENVVKDKEKKNNSISVVSRWGKETRGNAARSAIYGNSVNQPLSFNKAARIETYRELGCCPVVGDAIDEICDEAINKNEGYNFTLKKDRSPLNFDLYGEYKSEIKEELKKEFKKFVAPLKLRERGWHYFRTLLTEGELFFENIIDPEKPEKGVVGFKRICCSTINPEYLNLEKDEIKCFQIQQAIHGNSTGNSTYGNPTPAVQLNPGQSTVLTLHKNQVTYCFNDKWDKTKTYRLPFVENVRHDYQRLENIKDAIVIYRLIRAPERLVFNLNTGQLGKADQEAELDSFIQEYRQRKTIGDGGGITSTYDATSMLEDFFFTFGKDEAPSTVQSIATGQNLGQLEDLNFFLEQVYKSLKVPVSRLNPESQATADSSSIARDELRFAKFVMRIQEQFAEAIKESFIVHLKLKQLNKDLNLVRQENLYGDHDPNSNAAFQSHLKLVEENVYHYRYVSAQQDGGCNKKDMNYSLWSQYGLQEEDINICFNTPTNFMALRSQEMFQIQVDNFNNLAGNESFSTTKMQKDIFNWTDKEILANREYLRQDAEFRWEVDNILEAGPDFREKLKDELTLGDDDAEFGGGGATTPLGGDEEIPEFGGEVPDDITDADVEPEPEEVPDNIEADVDV